MLYLVSGTSSLYLFVNLILVPVSRVSQAIAEHLLVPGCTTFVTKAETLFAKYD